MGIFTQRREVKIKVVEVEARLDVIKIKIRVTTTWFDGPFPLDEPRAEDKILTVGDEVVV